MMKMEMTTTQKDGKKSNKSVMKLKADEAGNTMLIEVLETDGKPVKDKTMMLYDIPNSTMVTLLESEKGEKSGMAMGFDTDAVQKLINEQMSDDSSQPTATFKSTGNTKTILGYNCEEYTFDSEESDGTAWMAEATGINTHTFFGLLNQRAAGKKSSHVVDNLAGYPDGLLLEMVTREKKSNDTVTMVVTELQLNETSSLAPSEYNVMSLGSMMGGN